MDSKEQYWFIINAKPRQESIVEKNLINQGIQAYLPIFKKKTRKRKLRLDVLTPLFSGYLFAQFNIEEHYHLVRYSRGVKAILGTDDFLWTISAEKIASIRAREENGIVVLTPQRQVFSPGEPIRIDDGDFEGWEGIFQEELPDRERAVILLTNIQYSSKMVVPLHFLCKSNGRKNR